MDAVKLQKVREMLERWAKNPKVEMREHWDDGNFDDSFAHGQDVMAGEFGEEARALLKELDEK